jgi:putative oxidoreductase
MTLSGRLARPMMAGIFIYGGVDALRDPQSKAKAADDVAPMIAEALQLPTTDTVTLVRINGAIQVLAGTMLALGKLRRISAVALAASLVPTTYAGHRFWEEVDHDRRDQQRVQFLKNLAMLGGLVLAAGDTGGRPSIPWRARHAAHHAAAYVPDIGDNTVKALSKAAKRGRKAGRHMGEQALEALGVSA